MSSCYTHFLELSFQNPEPSIMEKCPFLCFCGRSRMHILGLIFLSMVVTHHGMGREDGADHGGQGELICEGRVASLAYCDHIIHILTLLGNASECISLQKLGSHSLWLLG